MKLKKIIVSLAWLSSSALATTQAAVELTPEKAAALQPFMNITLTERCNSIHSATTAVSRRADKLGADGFYIHHYGNSNNSGNWRILAYLYHKDSPALSEAKKYRNFNGIKELTESEAWELEFFDTVSIKGFFLLNRILMMPLQKRQNRKVQMRFLSCARPIPVGAAINSSAREFIKHTPKNANTTTRILFLRKVYRQQLLIVKHPKTIPAPCRDNNLWKKEFYH